jgi:hypothetical protein
MLHGGIKAHTEDQGLLTIVASGTIHQENTCAGAFQQLFVMSGQIQSWQHV